MHRGKKIFETTLEILKLSETLSVKEIAERLNLPYSNVAQRLHYYSVKTKGRQSKTGKNYNVAEIAKTVTDTTFEETGKQYGVSKQFISSLLKGNGYIKCWIKKTDYDRIMDEDVSTNS